MSEAAAATRELGRRAHAGRWLLAAAGVLLAITMATALALTVLPVFGYRALVMRSGSMAPAIEAGDLIVARRVEPSEVGPGDVVTFGNTSGDGDLVTHRVVEASAQGGTFTFVTKGDANSASETWSTDEDAALGLVAATVPNAGYVVAVLALPLVRAALLIVGAVILGGAALLRIWRR